MGGVRTRGRAVARRIDRVLLRRAARAPFARTLRAAGARVPFVSTPKIYRKFHAAESARLADVELLEAPDRFDAFAQLSRHQPDLVVANLNVANALEGMGFNVKWSTELTFQPIRGFSGASTLFRMFAAPGAVTTRSPQRARHPDARASDRLDFFRSGPRQVPHA